MDHLFKAVTIVQQSSPLHGEVVDLYISHGILQKIGPNLDFPNAQVVFEEGLCCSVGWFDLGAFVGEPGFEHRETLASFTKAAAYGGYTEVACLPNLNPVTQSKSTLEFLQQKSKNQPVQLHPMAAVTAQLEGEDLAELLDLKEAGAVAFSDGHTSIQSSDTVLKALHYLKMVGGVLVNRSENARTAQGGQMHEGLASTQLGLKGIPAMAEEMQVTRDLQLAAYAEGRIHFSQISTAGAVEAIRKAKAAGLKVTCDVAAHQLAFTDDTLIPFDTNYKVAPPFRSEQDRKALLEGLADGTIDTLVSAHTPWDEEAKDLEFDLAEPGIIGLQTAFSVAVASLSPQVDWQQVVEKITVGARKALALPVPSLAEGAAANLTFFHPTKKWTFTELNNASKSKNSPFLDQELTGCVWGIIRENQFMQNPNYPSA